MKNFTLLFLALFMSVSVGAQKATQVKKAKAQTPVRQSQVLGTAGDLINNVKGMQKITASFTPIDESFETEDNGWTITDGADLMSSGAGLTDTPAVDGDAYLISMYDGAASRNAWAISPSTYLEAGTTYYVSVYAYVPGYEGVNDEFAITVGQGDTAIKQSTILIDKKGDNAESIQSFTQFKAEFTPTESGLYNFGINHCTVAKDVNAVAFDLFQVHDAPIIPTAKIAEIAYTGGLCSYDTDHGNDVFLAGSTSNIYLNASTSNVTSFAWMAPLGVNIVGDATTSALVANNLFAGNNTFTLSVAGDNESSDNSSITIASKEYAADATMFVSNISPAESAVMVTASADGFSYLAGPNSYFTQIAESFEMPANATISMNGFVHSAVYAGATIGTEPLTVSIKQAVDGMPGTVIKSYTTTLGEFFAGDSSVRSFTFPEPLQITGSFFIEFDFPTFTATATDGFGFATCWNRPAAVNSLYANYDGAWAGISDIFGQSVSSLIVIDATVVESADGIENEMAEKEIATESYYSLTGTEMAKPAQKGIYVKRVVYTDGTSKSVKCIH